MFSIFVSALLSMIEPGGASAFPGAETGESCKECHRLTIDEADKLLKTSELGAKVKSVDESPVKGIWQVMLVQQDRDVVAYIDYAKRFLLQGNLMPLEEVGSPEKLRSVDVKKIPLDDALVMGKKDARTKIIVFDDPDCPVCASFHHEIKKALKERPNIAFYLKLYPLDIHPDAYRKSKSIVCAKSLTLLEDAYAGKKIADPKCATDAIDKNVSLARSLGINGTPHIVLPDGRVIPGMVDAKTLFMLLDNP
jgi:thiol:disulfide interchange protein DsbC